MICVDRILERQRQRPDENGMQLAYFIITKDNSLPIIEADIQAVDGMVEYKSAGLSLLYSQATINPVFGYF